MAIPQKVIKFLEKAKVKYEPVKHKTVYTAHDKAATLRVPEKIVGKTLVMKFDRNVDLVLIPANKNLDKVKFKKVAKAKNVDFVKEAWMKKNLKGVKVGAIPAFGNLFKLPTFVEKSLLRNPKIILNSGDYNFSIKISSINFKKLIPGLITGSFGKAKK
ncbi:MAG: aminoacyl-tRNA deacylase [Candidatus Nealsonbacteria bacterium]